MPARLGQVDGLSQPRAVPADLAHHRPVVAALVFGRSEQQRDAGLPQHECEFVASVGRVDIDQDRPDPSGRVLHQHPVDAVRSPDADPVARREAAGKHAQRELIDGRIEFGVAQPAAGYELDDRVPVGVAGSGAGEISTDRVAEQAHRGGAAGIRQLQWLRVIDHGPD